MSKKFPSELASRGTVLPTDILLIHNITTGATEKTTVAELLKSLSTFAAGQIGFPATQIPSADVNTLDDYEEGTWSPVYEGTTGSAGAVAFDSTGTYTKAGRLMTVSGTMVLTNKGSWTGDVKISGIPASSNLAYGIVAAYTVTFDGQLVSRISTGETFFRFLVVKSAAGGTFLQTTGIANNSEFYFTLVYFTN